MMMIDSGLFFWATLYSRVVYVVSCRSMFSNRHLC